MYMVLIFGMRVTRSSVVTDGLHNMLC